MTKDEIMIELSSMKGSLWAAMVVTEPGSAASSIISSVIDDIHDFMVEIEGGMSCCKRHWLHGGCCE